MTIRIKPGTPIKWSSTTYRIEVGRFCNKRGGVYMGYCPPKTRPETTCPALADVPSSAKKFGYSNGTSLRKRVIARVPCFHKTTGEPIAPHWYGPRVSAITHAFIDGDWQQVDPEEIEWL